MKKNEQPTERKFKSMSKNLDFVNLEKEGDYVEGYYRKCTTIQNKKFKKVQNVYTLLTDSGNKSIGGNGLLDFIFPNIEIGSFIRIVFKGTKKFENKQGMKVTGRQYEVLVDENEKPIKFEED